MNSWYYDSCNRALIYLVGMQLNTNRALDQCRQYCCLAMLYCTNLDLNLRNHYPLFSSPFSPSFSLLLWLLINLLKTCWTEFTSKLLCFVARTQDIFHEKLRLLQQNSECVNKNWSHDETLYKVSHAATGIVCVGSF